MQPSLKRCNKLIQSLDERRIHDLLETCSRSGIGERALSKSMGTNTTSIIEHVITEHMGDTLNERRTGNIECFALMIKVDAIRSPRFQVACGTRLPRCDISNEKYGNHGTHYP